MASVVRLGDKLAVPTRPAGGLNAGGERKGRGGLWHEEPKDGAATAL